MTIDLESRRPVRSITRADFAAYPVWEWAINEHDTLGQDASFLRPTSLGAVPAGVDGHFVVGASVTLSDGSVLAACVEVLISAKRHQCAPMFILLPDRQLDFAGQATATVLSHYTKVNGVKPVSWELAVPVDGQGVPGGLLRTSLAARVATLGRRLGMPFGPSRSPSSHLL